MVFVQDDEHLVDQVERPAHGVFVVLAANIDGDRKVTLPQGGGDAAAARIDALVLRLMAIAA